MRKRFEDFGAQSLSDHEMLEMLLYLAVPRSNTNETAHRLIERFGSFCGVMNADPAELVQVDGVGEKSAHVIKLTAAAVGRYIMCDNSIIVSSFDGEKIGKNLIGLFAGESVEKLYLLVLDTKGKLVERKCIATGTVSSVAAHINDIANVALRNNSPYVVLAHNHTCGCAAPSTEDINLTMHLKEVLGMMNITLLEHFVVADNRYYTILGQLK